MLLIMIIDGLMGGKDSVWICQYVRRYARVDNQITVYFGLRLQYRGRLHLQAAAVLSPTPTNVV